MKVWKVSYAHTKYFGCKYDALAESLKGLSNVSELVGDWLRGTSSTVNVTTEMIRKELLDFAEFGLPEEVEIEEMK